MAGKILKYISLRGPPKENKDVSHCLVLESGKGNMKGVRFLLRHGADINSQSMGYSPLSRACCKGNSEMAFYLLSRNADPFFRPDSGLDAFAFAAERGRFRWWKRWWPWGGDPPIALRVESQC